MRLPILTMCVALAVSVAMALEVSTTATAIMEESSSTTAIPFTQSSSDPTTPCIPSDFYYSAISFYCTICFKMTSMVLNNYSIKDASNYFEQIYCQKLGIFKKRCLKSIESLIDPIRTQLAPECEGEPIDVTASYFCQNVVGMCYLQDNSDDCPSYVLGVPNLQNLIIRPHRDEL